MLKFEPVAVLDVITDNDSTNLATIVGQFTVSDQDEINVHKFYPLDSGILKVPVVGEVVLGTEFLGRYYYMSKLNFRNISPIADTMKNIATLSKLPSALGLGKYFSPNKRGRKRLIFREGDTVIQGRFGNSIRLGSNQVEDFLEQKEKKDYEFINSPNIKLVSGIRKYPNNLEGYSEQLDYEQSSIYLTTKESVKFTFDKDEEVENIGESPQITIQSDSIVFHGKEDITSYTKNFNIRTADEGKIRLGSLDENELEFALLAKSLENILVNVFQELEKTDIGSGNSTKPLPFAGKLSSKLKNEFSKAVSKTVMIKK